MGYSLSWLAVRGKTSQAVLDEPGFRATGEREQIPESPHSASRLPNGWFLIVSNHTEQVVSDSMLAQVSADCEAVTCFVEEHVMVSSATGWKNGLRCWSVNHDAQRGIDHLQTEGDLPVSFNAIRDGLVAKQKEENIRKAVRRRPLFPRKVLLVEEMGCDYMFDIPVELAREITGYRHDQDIPGLADEAFEVLMPVGPNKSAEQREPSVWKRLFGVQALG